MKAWLGTAAVMALAWAGTPVTSAQTAAASQAPKAWAGPRTPWGDPDLQGTYTNTYENGTPLERPQEFEGRTLSDVSREELQRARRAIQARTCAPSEWNWKGPGLTAARSVQEVAFSGATMSSRLTRQGVPSITSRQPSQREATLSWTMVRIDRKSTRLNSSH